MDLTRGGKSPGPSETQNRFTQSMVASPLDWSIPRENSHRKVLCFQWLLDEFFRSRQVAKKSEELNLVTFREDIRLSLIS
jgi:hypothetical protein